MNSKTAFTCSGAPSSTVSSVTCGCPTGLTPRSSTALLKRSGSRPSITSLRISRGKAAPDHRLRHLAGAEAGNLCVFAIVAGPRCGRPWRPLRRGCRAPVRGCIGVENRACVWLVIVAFVVMVVAFMIVAFVAGVACRPRPHQAEVVFECVSRTQRFAFQARCASRSNCQLAAIKRPALAQYSQFSRKLPCQAANRRCRAAVQGAPAPCGWGNISSHGKRVCWQGQTGQARLTARGAPRKARYCLRYCSVPGACERKGEIGDGQRRTGHSAPEPRSGSAAPFTVRRTSAASSSSWPSSSHQQTGHSPSVRRLQRLCIRSRGSENELRASSPRKAWTAYWGLEFTRKAIFRPPLPNLRNGVRDPHRAALRCYEGYRRERRSVPVRLNGARGENADASSLPSERRLNPLQDGRPRSRIRIRFAHCIRLLSVNLSACPAASRSRAQPAGSRCAWPSSGLGTGMWRAFCRAAAASNVQLVGIADADPALFAKYQKKYSLARDAVLSQERGQHDRGAPSARQCWSIRRSASIAMRSRSPPSTASRRWWKSL